MWAAWAVVVITFCSTRGHTSALTVSRLGIGNSIVRLALRVRLGELSQDNVVRYINIRVNGERPYKIPAMPKMPPAWLFNAAIRDEVSYQAFYRYNPKLKEPVQLDEEIIREAPGATEIDTVLWNVPIRPRRG